MLIRFLRDFRSTATLEVFYEAGQSADLERGAEVVAEGAAIAVPLVAREGQVEPTAPEPTPAEEVPAPESASVSRRLAHQKGRRP